MEYSDDEDESNKFDDAEDDVDIHFRSLPEAAPTEASAVPSAQPSYYDNDDDDGGDAAPVPVEAVHVEAVPVIPVSQQSRGKPEAMAAALAAQKIDHAKEKLEAEKQEAAVAVIAELVPPDVSSGNAVDAKATPIHDVEVKPPPKKKKKKKAPAQSKKSPASASKKKARSASPLIELDAPSLDDPVDPITEAEYENLRNLMDYFCKVPLLAEFSRPVTLLHPELMANYSKIVSHPIDLGRVCRKIGRQEYKSTREVQLDMWRIFSNCVKYHSSPTNKEGVPSFVSIALHLREFWNNLFQEFLLPSDLPKEATAATARDSAKMKYLREAFATREADRKKRLIVSGLTCLSTNCMMGSAEKITKFIENGGCVDRLDTVMIFPTQGRLPDGIDEEDLKDLQVVMQKMASFRDQLIHFAAEGAEYTVEQFDRELKNCYMTDVFENNSGLRFRIRNRLDRFVGKILVPINEANCRGVTQSSIWGCMAAAIWARESSKKPFWPALVLGILAPEDQKEDWHWALTERNEQRLPDALRAQLATGKRKAEQALKRQSQGQADPQSFFLVEFLGTHEFIWVRETDIVESFEPDDDPNLKTPASKKKSRAKTSSLVGTKKYQAAIEEAGWALEEFEMQLQDACGDMGEAEDGEDGNYSYAVLCLSDDEADDVYEDKEEMTMSEVEEANELIATRGLIDFSATGRKNAKKRALALKKQKAEAEKKEKLDKAKKTKANQAKKKKKEMAAAKKQEVDDKRELKELEKRRKKRSREREKALKSKTKNNNKKRRTTHAERVQQYAAVGGPLMRDKRSRATAIVKGYLTRMSKNDEYKSLGLQGIMNLPAAMVDSSGLLGMSLAFRAAAGELVMPEESGDAMPMKPWDTITLDETMSPEAREAALRKQVDLLEREIVRVREATATRLKLAEDAATLRRILDEKIEKDEDLARTNPFKKKKKVIGSSQSTKSLDDSPADKSEQGKDYTDVNTRGMDHGEAEISLGPNHVSDTPLKQPTADVKSTEKESANAGTPMRTAADAGSADDKETADAIFSDAPMSPSKDVVAAVKDTADGTTVVAAVAAVASAEATSVKPSPDANTNGSPADPDAMEVE